MSSANAILDGDSETSTITYGHEPFATFKDRALELAQISFWAFTPTDITTVDRMKGGGSNRIVGLIRRMYDIERERHYILRIPRFQCDLASSVAVLQFLRKYSKINVPTVFWFDETSNNQLRQTYILQSRIYRGKLLDWYSKMYHDSRCQIAQQIGEIYQQMLSLRSEVPGRIRFSEQNKDLDAPLYVEPFEGMNLPKSLYRDAPPAAQSAHSMLKSLFQCRQTMALAKDPPDHGNYLLAGYALTMAKELDAGDWLGNNQISLCHQDLGPRTIFVFDMEETSSWRISGIIDWDNAIFAPSFLSCVPPNWVWEWQEDWPCLHTSEELLELRHIFEAAAGQDYRQYADRVEYKLARQLVLFAIHGIRDNRALGRFEAMLRAWADISGKPDLPSLSDFYSEVSYT